MAGSEVEPPSGEGEPRGSRTRRFVEAIFDGIIGALAGLVGMSLMTMVFLAAASVGAFDWNNFAVLTELLGLEERVPPVAFGYFVFVLVGLVQWPLLFAALKDLLPGEYDIVHGISFGTVLWTGFVIAYYDGQAGGDLALYLAFSLVAHWAYGAGLGLVFQYFTTREEPLV